MNLIAHWSGFLFQRQRGWYRTDPHPVRRNRYASATGDRMAHPGIRRRRPRTSRVILSPSRSRTLAPAMRRSLNVSAAAILLLLALPLMVVIALAVRLSSPGPVIFSQPRVGIDRRRERPGARSDPRRTRDLGGRIFRIYKFRTMEHRPAEEEQTWATPDDPRITGVGRILRRFRLDELPQLFNVLKGDMNLVGPRPEQPRIFRELRKEIREYPRRQRVLPGITGLAQVNHHYDRCLDDVKRKVSYDLAYVERESPVEDLRIMIRTVPVMLLGKGSV